MTTVALFAMISKCSNPETAVSLKQSIITKLRSLLFNTALQKPSPLKMGKHFFLSSVCAQASGYRMIFNLYAIEGYKHKEIAEMLGINEGTSKSQLSHARRILQEEVRKSKNYEMSQN